MLYLFDVIFRVYMKIFHCLFLYFINNMLRRKHFPFSNKLSQRLVICLLLVSVSKSFADMFVISVSKLD